MGDFVVKIFDMFGGWGWISLGILIIVGFTVILAVYLRDWPERQALLYSLRNYAIVVAIGLAAIMFGIVKLKMERPTAAWTPSAKR